MNVEARMKEHMTVPEEEKCAGYPFKVITQESTREQEKGWGDGAIKVIKKHECVPPYIISEENIIDELTSKEAREKMDEAHNKMMEKKFNIYHGFSGAADSDQTGIFDDVEKCRHNVSDKMNILTSTSLLDEEYRRITEDFLKTLLPKVEAEYTRLSDEITRLGMEKRDKIFEYDQKIRQAMRDKNNFEIKVADATIKKFEHVDSVGGLTKWIDGMSTDTRNVLMTQDVVNDLKIILTQCELIHKSLTEEPEDVKKRKEVLDQTKEAMKKPASFFERITGRK